jgi:hypothetical protein
LNTASFCIEFYIQHTRSIGIKSFGSVRARGQRGVAAIAACGRRWAIRVMAAQDRVLTL